MARLGRDQADGVPRTPLNKGAVGSLGKTRPAPRASIRVDPHPPEGRVVWLGLEYECVAGAKVPAGAAP